MSGRGNAPAHKFHSDLPRPAVKADGKAVVVIPEKDETVVKSARNIPGVSTTTATILSVYDILNAKKLVIDQTALAKIEEVFA